MVRYLAFISLCCGLIWNMLPMGFAQAQKLVAYCPFADEDCNSVLKAFEADSGIETSFVRMGAGEIVARIRAEKDNPQAGLWLGGPLDTFITAAEDGLIAPHKAKNIEKVNPNYVHPDYYWTPMSRSPMILVYSEQILQEIGAKVPTSWQDFADPVFRNNIAMAHPAFSGTGYAWIATMVQIYGEDEAFELMKKVNENVLQYTRSGLTPYRMVVGNEIALGMVFFQDAEAALRQGYSVGHAFAEEGTGFEVTGTAIIAGAPGDQAQSAAAFLDWILTDRGQTAIGATFRPPVISGEKSPEQRIDPDDIKVIDYDFVWAGENRARLLERYEREVRRGADAK